jgi:hypothetical protein
MNTSTKPEFLLIFRDSNQAPDPSAAEMEAIMGKWMAWLNGLKAQGTLVGGNRLEDGRKIVRGAKFTDGPFVESKEVVSGYIVILADTLGKAEKVAHGCPGLDYGTIVEVRPMVPSHF